MNVYVIGNLIRVSVAFTNSAGTAIDPAGVTCYVSDVEGTITDYVYGTDAEVVKDSTGAYHLDIDADQAGEWRYRWVGTGSGQAAAEGAFVVQVSPFTEEEA